MTGYDGMLLVLTVILALAIGVFVYCIGKLCGWF